MRRNLGLWFLAAIMGWAGIIEGRAEDAPSDEAVDEATAAARFLVILPEQIDTEWYWYYYTETAQNIVQSAVEKELARKGLDVIDLQTLSMLGEQGQIEELLKRDQALDTARKCGAAYLVLGQASAVMSGRSKAYGMEVIRSRAQASAKLIRVSDGKVLGVEDASAEEGGQIQKATGQAALTKAGRALAKQVARLAEKTANP